MPASGDLLAGRYRILAPLGAGGMATVHRAHDERLGREVAVKILLPNLAGDPVLATRFEREARTLAAAAHPGVVSIFDVDAGEPRAGREPFFVMELCPGGSLADQLVDGRRVRPDELIPSLVSIADGLADLHARGVVHRDVKPSNILFASDRAKLADFGLARADGVETDELTTPGTAVGTMAYLAPEVVGGETATAASDVYALGVAAFAGLTGRLPRSASSLTELVASAREAAPTVSSVAPDLGTAFDAPIAHALDVDATVRPDALDFASSMTAALGAWGRARPSAATGAPPASPSDLGSDATTAIPWPAPVADLETDATTATAVPTDASAAAERASESLAPGGPAERSTHWRAPAAVAIAVILAALALWGLLGTVLRTGSLAPLASPTVSGLVSPSPGNLPSASVIAASSPTTVIGRALAALDDVDRAISATTGKDGLKGNERNELERRARQVRSALESGDIEAARSAAEDLADQVNRLDKKLDKERARDLREAVATLVDILGGD